MSANLPPRLSQLDATSLATELAEVIGDTEQNWVSGGHAREVIRLELHLILTRFAAAMGPQVSKL